MGGLVGNRQGNKKTIVKQQDSVPKFLNVVRFFPAPGPCSSQPQGHKTASKFQRIRCTICLTSPDNQKEKRPHLKDVCLPFHNDLTWCRVTAKVAAKTEVCGCSVRLPKEECITQGSDGTAGIAGQTLKKLENGKAGCCNLLRWITKLKCVNSEVRDSHHSPLKRVASNGSMAPCRSHHGNHTRQEWIIIWSGRNWILKHADWCSWTNRKWLLGPCSEEGSDASKTNRKWPKVIPDCDNREVKILLCGSRLGRLPFRKIDIETAGTSRWSAWISLRTP